MGTEFNRDLMVTPLRLTEVRYEGRITWVFVFGHAVIQLMGQPESFSTRAEAVIAATEQGIVVEQDNVLALRMDKRWDSLSARYNI